MGMRRTSRNTCPVCGGRWTQSWEDPDECPYCHWPEVPEGDEDENDEADGEEEV